MLYCIRRNSVVHSTQINPLFYKKELLRISVVSNIRCDAGMGNNTDVPDYVNEEEKNVNEMTQKVPVRRTSEIPEPAPGKKDNSHLYKPHGQDDSELSKFAHNDSREPQYPERESKTQTTTEVRAKTVGKSNTPYDPFVGQEHNQPQISEEERERRKRVDFRAKEAAEAIARKQYAEEHGTTAKDFANMVQKNKDKKPYEQMVPINRSTLSNPHHVTTLIQKAGNYVNDNVVQPFSRGAVGERTPAEKKAGLHPVSVLEKLGESYRPSPQPRFKAGKGTKATSPTKGTVVSKVQKGIDFGSGGVLFGGLSTGAGSQFAFNTPLFGGRDSMQEAPKGQPKRKKGR